MVNEGDNDSLMSLTDSRNEGVLHQKLILASPMNERPQFTFEILKSCKFMSNSVECGFKMLSVFNCLGF